MSPPAELLARLGAALGELERVRFAVPEDEPAAARGALFAPRLERRLDEALALVEAARAHYERATAGAAGAGDETLDNAPERAAAELAGQELLDLLRAGRDRLAAARQDLLAAVAQREPLRVAGSCDSGLRALRRTLVALESGIHDFEGLPQPTRAWPDLEVSLRTRELYTGLRRDLLVPLAPPEGELADRLAAAHDRLARLRELDLYPLLRFDDRVAMRDLRLRLARWVTSEAQDPVEGARLGLDLSDFAARIAAVSDRAELRQHDRSLLRRAWHALFGPAAQVRRDERSVALGADQLQQLEALRGLDGDLDRLLDGHGTDELARWREVLARLLHRLSGPVAAPAVSVAPRAGQVPR